MPNGRLGGGLGLGREAAESKLGLTREVLVRQAPSCSTPQDASGYVLVRLLGCRAVRNQQAEAPEWPRAEGTRAGEREKKCASCRAGSSLSDDAGFVCRGSRWGNKTRQAVAQRQRFRSACLAFATDPTRLGRRAGRASPARRTLGSRCVVSFRVAKWREFCAPPILAG
jgi:hypothetical protein